MNTSRPDPYHVLGLTPDASPAEITAAYRRAVRACHPDTACPDRERFAAVLAAYHLLRDQQQRRDQRIPHHPQHAQGPRPAGGTTIPVRHHRPHTPREPDLRAGPVRHHLPDS